MSLDIYFDNSATTRPFDDVIDLITDINKNYFGNSSSLHRKGLQAEKLVNNARQIISKSLGAATKEIIFTSGGTEGNNFAIRGYLEANPRKGKHIITSVIEHPSVLEVYKHLEGKGYRVSFINVDKRGIIDLEELKSKIDDDTALISIMHVNNETGAIQPIEEIVRIKNTIKRDIAIHVDAVQSYGKIKLIPSKVGIDMLSISSHKIHGPKGSGVLYVNKNTKIKPILFGGGQESGYRSGTENITGICGFGLASEKIYGSIEANHAKVSEIKNALIDKLTNEVHDVIINSQEESSPYVLNVSFKDVKAEVLLHSLEMKGIYVSTGSACSSKKTAQSHVLTAMGIDRKHIDGAIRLSFSSLNELSDVDAFINELKSILPVIKIRHGGR